eukprot:364599-Chlamydomonas_euryale.AAC.11
MHGAFSVPLCGSAQQQGLGGPCAAGFRRPMCSKTAVSPPSLGCPLWKLLAVVCAHRSCLLANRSWTARRPAVLTAQATQAVQHTGEVLEQ